MKKLLYIKYENIFTILLIPVAIMGFIKAHNDFKILSILIYLLLIFATNYGLKEMRRDLIKEYDSIVLEIKEELEGLLLAIDRIIHFIKEKFYQIAQKKEVIQTRLSLLHRPKQRTNISCNQNNFYIIKLYQN